MSDSGIYKIENKVSEKIYIGSTNDFDKRFKDHKYKLKTERHENEHLQNSFNKCGMDDFEFSKILICSTRNLLMYEQKVLDSYKETLGWDKLYNIAKDVERNELSEEAINKISGENHYEWKESIEFECEECGKVYYKRQSREGISKYCSRDCQVKSYEERYSGKGNPNYGNTKLTDWDVEEIKRMLNGQKTYKEIADSFGVSSRMISDISDGNRWDYI